MNPIEVIVQNMIRQGGGNIEAVARNILKNNPQFAQSLQKRGLNPQSFMNNFRR